MDGAYFLPRDFYNPAAVEERRAALERASGGRGAILLLETDDVYADAIRSILERDGWVVTHVRSVEDALPHAQNGTTALVIEALPSAAEGGNSALGALRQISPSKPIVALTEPDVTEAVVRDVLQHADTEVAKPFSPRRLRAAVRSVARRGRRNVPLVELPAEARVGDLTVSAGQLLARVGERVVSLSPREFSLLHFLVAHPGAVFTREELAHHAWGWSESVDSRAIDNAVSRLRRKIEPGANEPTYLLTERGEGYRLAVP